MTLPTDIPATAEVDQYQARYLAHQGRKRATLIEVMRSRHSDRMFADTPVDEPTRAQLREVIDLCPSSCDRRGVYVTEVDSRDERELLGGVLVGGVGWVHRSPWVLLLFADPLAYKAPGEISFMPFLDAGAMIQQLQLRATDLGLAVAYVNPNLRPHNREHFHKIFGEGVFCGALAIGWSHEDSPDRKRAEVRRTGVDTTVTVNVDADPPDAETVKGNGQVKTHA